MAIFLLVYPRYDIMFYRFLFQDHHSERAVYMPQRPVAPGPGWDADPGRVEGDWLAWCEAVEEQLGPDEDEPEDAAPWDVDIDALIAECREITAEEAAFAARAARLGLPGGTPIGEGRRGPGQLGSAVRRPGEFVSRAAGFGAGMALDVMPGCGALAGFAAEAAGDDDRYESACDDEVAGAVAAWDRVEAYAAARKHAAVAEFIRRRPRPGSPPEGPAQLPESWDESITAEVAGVLAESRRAADAMLDLAHDLEVKLPGTKAAFYDGILRQSKVAIIARATALLDAAETRAAEDKVLDRAGRLTPGGLRAAIARAVMEVAPEKARQRREVAAKFARVERWAEDSGNAALAGRELPPDYDPGVRLRHLTQVRQATCTGPGCRRPAAQCDFEHNTPYEAGGRTCLCNAGPKCRRDHRLKQHPRWNVSQLPDGTFRWTTPTGRQYTTEPTRYPVWVHILDTFVHVVGQAMMGACHLP